MKEQYITYSAIQLASEDSFIGWVMHGANAQEWEAWLRQHSHVLTTAELARQIVLNMMHLPEYTLTNEEQQGLWDKIASDISLPSTKGTILKSRILQWVTVAAAAIALLIWFNTRQNPTMVQTLAGEQREIQLPESSQIQLNAGSSLVYNSRNFDSHRELTLVGEAFFKVHPGSRFTVNTPQGSITVLGTSFNVVAWPDRFEVSCFTGKVKVVNQHHDQLTIMPGERCTNNETTQKLTSRLFPVTSDAPDWTKGKFVFENQSLKIVVEELERQYNIKVKLAPGLDQLKYVGLFESGDLDKALSLITWPLHLKAEKNGNTVLIGR
jgi:transmembrane sensor